MAPEDRFTCKRLLDVCVCVRVRFSLVFMTHIYLKLSFLISELLGKWESG